VGIPLALVAFNTLMQRVTEGAVMGRVAAAAEAAIGVPQALSIALGAALAAVVDFRILYLLMALVQLVAAAYLWVARALSPSAEVPATSIGPESPSAQPGQTRPRPQRTSTPQLPTAGPRETSRTTLPPSSSPGSVATRPGAPTATTR